MGTLSGLNYRDHPAGGCRMGGDAATSVTDTLTFVALTLRSAEQIARA